MSQPAAGQPAAGRPTNPLTALPDLMADDPERVAGRVAVALGERPADLVVRGGSVVDVYTGEVHAGWDVAVAGGWIAYVGPPQPGLAGPDTDVVDARGGYVAPGFIDGHVHWGFLARLDEYVRHALPLGTTAAMTETTDIAGGLGAAGVRAFLDAAARMPCRVWAASPQPFHLEVFGLEPALDLDAARAFLDHPGVLSLGEVYWPLVTTGHPAVLDLIQAARARGKAPQGHGAGARGVRAQAFAAAGITSDHEPIAAEEALDRLRAGMHVLVRQGSIRQDLPAVGAIRAAGADLRRLGAASDGIWPDDLLERGHMDWVLRAAVAAGFGPVEAIRMVTLVAAEYYGLDAALGGVAPGKLADLVVLPDLERFRPATVICGGRVVARDGALLADVPPVDYPRVPLRLDEVPGPGAFDRAAGRAAPGPGIRLVTELVTELVTAGPVDPDTGTNLAALVHRPSGRVAAAPLLGYGLRAGAVATATSWDAGAPVVIGADPEAMATAIRAMADAGGDALVVRGGEVLARVPLPYCGGVSDLPLPELAGAIRAWEAAARTLGCALERPFLAVSTLTFTAVPAVRLSPRGLVDVRRRALIPGPT